MKFWYIKQNVGGGKKKFEGFISFRETNGQRMVLGLSNKKKKRGSRRAIKKKSV